ncbi:MAG TPA: ATP-binding cassette domain-containing protein [Acidobacteriota bacterium]|nr:ATP-binding cassette domain-containing protein [Acidobacteriota bacterium]HQG91258.1 ATP-binding cassette domain-containing protein [Acidobacteriota bacterium]
MIVSVRSVRKRFGNFCAVDGVEMGVPPGVIYGLLGPNGAGKTTTIRMILGIFLPDEGSIDVFGKPMDDAARDRIGYLPEERGLYRKMKVRDLLMFFARSHGLSQKEAAERVNGWLERVELPQVARKKVEELSKGMQQKIQLISTILHEPELLILDEPFSGLDPINLQLMKDIFLELHNRGTTVIFSTHNMEEAEKMCNSICLINKGRVVVEGDLHHVKESYGHSSILIDASGPLEFLKKLDYVAEAELYENYAEVRLQDGQASGRLLEDLVRQPGLTIRKFEQVAPTLRNIFIERVKGDSHEN